MKHYVITFPCPPTTDEKIMSAAHVADVYWATFSIIEGTVRIDCHPINDQREARLFADEILKELLGIGYTFKLEN